MSKLCLSGLRAGCINTKRTTHKCSKNFASADCVQVASANIDKAEHCTLYNLLLTE